MQSFILLEQYLKVPISDNPVVIQKVRGAGCYNCLCECMCIHAFMYVNFGAEEGDGNKMVQLQRVKYSPCAGLYMQWDLQSSL